MAVPFNPCDFLFARWKNLALWRNLWTILIFLLGAAFTIFLIGAVFLFVRASWIPAALSTLGTIANGVAVGWVLARRNQAVDEETQAKQELLAQCSGVAAAAPQAAPAGQAPPSLADRIEAAENNLKLFGAFR